MIIVMQCIHILLYSLTEIFCWISFHPQIPGLPYRPMIGNMNDIRSGQAMEASIKYALFSTNQAQFYKRLMLKICSYEF